MTWLFSSSFGKGLALIMFNPGAIVFLILATITVSLSTFLSAVDEFTLYDRKIISGIIASVLLLQLVITYVVYRLLKNTALTNVILAIFLVFNVACMRLVFDASFLVQPVYIQILLLIIGLFVSHTLFKALQSKNNGWVWGGVFAAVFAVIDLWPNITDDIKAEELPGDVRLEEDGTASRRVQLVEFTKKPNVYVVAFDSLIPRSLVNDNLNLEEVPYLPVLEKEFNSFRNVFADAVYTKNSLNAILALDVQWFWDIGDHRTALFQGKLPSPLFQIFKNNGYETNTLYRSNYFGIGKGKYVDRYFTARSFSACEFIDEKQVLAFFGYCRFQQTKYWSEFVDSSFGEEKRNEIDWMLDRFEEADNSGKPQVFLAYIYSPGHTKKHYDHADEGERFDYIEWYEERSFWTAKMIEKVVDYVWNRDNSDVLIVLGDHGPKMSAGSKFDSDPKFFVIDRYGVFGGVYSDGVCANELAALREERFVTPTKIMRMAIHCLSDGQDPFTEEPEYVLQKNKFLPQTLRYEDFLYE